MYKSTYVVCTVVNDSYYKRMLAMLRFYLLRTVLRGAYNNTGKGVGFRRASTPFHSYTQTVRDLSQTKRNTVGLLICSHVRNQYTDMLLRLKRC